jgi:putative IMPACT (imprinted ancient) family translation regulator
LIQAYKEAAAEALRQAVPEEKIIKDQFEFEFDYALMPDVMQALHKLEIEILHQQFDERGRITIGIRKSETKDKLLKIKALVWKVSIEEADGLGWPSGLKVCGVEG